jgi:hypothetical protein
MGSKADVPQAKICKRHDIPKPLLSYGRATAGFTSPSVTFGPKVDFPPGCVGFSPWSAGLPVFPNPITGAFSAGNVDPVPGHGSCWIAFRKTGNLNSVQSSVVPPSGSRKRQLSAP